MLVENKKGFTMKIEETFSQTLTSSSQKNVQFDGKFQNILEKNMTENVKSDDLSDLNVDSFREKLLKLGSVAFLQEFNIEKIENMLREKEKELKAKLGLDDENKSAEEKSKLQNMLDEMMVNYKKQLYEQLKAKKELEALQKDKDKKPSLLAQVFSKDYSVNGLNL